MRRAQGAMVAEIFKNAIDTLSDDDKLLPQVHAASIQQLRVRVD